MLNKIYQFFLRLFGLEDEPASTLHSTPSSTDSSNGTSSTFEYEDAGDLPPDIIEKVISTTTDNALEEPTVTTTNSTFSTSTATGPSSDSIITVTTPKFLWCLDNGHGVLQAGKRSPIWSDGTQLEEWKFNREIVKRIARRLDDLGLIYFIVVPEDNVDSFLPERVARANDLISDLGLPKIYVSVHGNAAQSSDATGVENWYFLGSNSGVRLASIFQKHILSSLGSAGTYQWVDRGIRTFTPASRNFFVLRETQMPAVLSENGFYTNEIECRMMLNPEVQDRIAEGHINAILEIESKGYMNASIYPVNTEITLR